MKAATELGGGLPMKPGCGCEVQGCGRDTEQLLCNATDGRRGVLLVVVTEVGKRDRHGLSDRDHDVDQGKR